MILLVALPRWRRAVLRAVPPPLFAYPFELLLAVMCLVSGTSLFAGAPAPTSVNALLPGWLVQVWAATLVLGALMTAWGLLRDRPGVAVLGLRMLGDAAAVYALVILVSIGARGVIAALITAAFSLSCLARAFALSTTVLIARAGDPPGGG